MENFNLFYFLVLLALIFLFISFDSVLCPTNPCGSTLELLRNYYFAITCTWVCNLKVVAIIIYNDEKEESERHTHFFLLCLDFAICGEKGERRWRSQAALKVESLSGGTSSGDGGELERRHEQWRRWRAWAAATVERRGEKRERGKWERRERKRDFYFRDWDVLKKNVDIYCGNLMKLLRRFLWLPQQGILIKPPLSNNTIEVV